MGVETNGTHLAITFPKRRDDGRLQYVPEVSSNKLDWLRLEPAQQIATTAGNDFDLVTYQDLTPIQPGQPRFIRLRVIKN